MLRATAQQKLNNVMGSERGGRFYLELCTELGLADIETPDDSLRFGNALISKGGMLASVGRSIKIMALLSGAREAR